MCHMANNHLSCSVLKYNSMHEHNIILSNFTAEIEIVCQMHFVAYITGIGINICFLHHAHGVSWNNSDNVAVFSIPLLVLLILSILYSPENRKELSPPKRSSNRL